MFNAVGQVAPFALAVAISPVPIIAATLMLSTPHARSNGFAFLVGWLAGLTLAGAVIFALSDGGERGEPATWVSALEIGIGVVAVAFAARVWRRRGRRSLEAPAWSRALDAFGPRRSTALALGLSCGNPKNLLLTVGAATAVAEAEGSAGEATGGLVAFVALGSLGVIAPVASYLVLGERSRRGLGALRRWLTRHEAVVLALILLAIGAKLLTGGISAL